MKNNKFQLNVCAVLIKPHLSKSSSHMYFIRLEMDDTCKGNLILFAFRSYVETETR